MPSETSKATDIKIVVNGKESGSSLTPELQLVPYQELEIYAKFTISDTTFTTNKETVIVEDDTTNVKLSLPKEVLSKIREKNEEAKKVEAQKAKVSTFLNDYRSAVFSSVSNRSNNHFSIYCTRGIVVLRIVVAPVRNRAKNSTAVVIKESRDFCLLSLNLFRFFVLFSNLRNHFLRKR